jgi:exodeoxyribonuclease VII small subunit
MANKLLRYSDLAEQLKVILESIETGETDVEELSGQYQTATDLVTRMSKILEEHQSKIALIDNKSNGRISESPH